MTAVINEVAKATQSILARRDPARRAITIRPVAARRSGKRARRSAFYHRARMCRLMTRIAYAGFQAQDAELQERFRNVVVYGTSHPEWFHEPKIDLFGSAFTPDEAVALFADPVDPDPRPA